MEKTTTLNTVKLVTAIADDWIRNDEQDACSYKIDSDRGIIILALDNAVCTDSGISVFSFDEYINDFIGKDK